MSNPSRMVLMMRLALGVVVKREHDDMVRIDQLLIYLENQWNQLAPITKTSQR